MTDTQHGHDRVILSRNETESLCMKAARGAGFSWGLAEEVGFATGWLAAQGMDGASALLAMLTRKMPRSAIAGTPKAVPGHWQSLDDSPLCPIQLGVALSDRAAIEGGPFSEVTLLDPVDAPLLLLPFLVRAAQLSQRTLTLDWQGGRQVITPDGLFNRQAACGLDRAKCAGHEDHTRIDRQRGGIVGRTIPPSVYSGVNHERAWRHCP